MSAPSQPSSVSIRVSEPSSSGGQGTPNVSRPATPEVSPPLRSALKNGYLSDSAGASSSRLPSTQPSAPMSRTSTGASLPHGYRKGVGFDTFPSGEEASTGGGTGINYGFTMHAKSPNYLRNKNTRTFLVGTDLNEYSVHALDWLLNNLLESGDEIIVFRVFDPVSSKDNTTLSPAIIAQTQEEAREEANYVLESILEALPDLSVSIVLEFCIGKIQPTIQRMIRLYKPDSLVVGTRGRSDSVWRATFMGSTSKYCLSSSPVPVIVVRPERKVRKSIEARKARSSYSNLMISAKPTIKHSQSYGATPLVEESQPSRAATPTPAAVDDSVEPTAEPSTPPPAQPLQPASDAPSAPTASTSSAASTAQSGATVSPSNNVRKPSVLSQLNFPEDKDLIPKILTMGMWGALNKNSKELKRSKTAPS